MSIGEMSEESATAGASVVKAWPESQWYAMLFPSEGEGERLAARLAELAALTGGAANASLHVTIGYFTGDPTPAAVVDAAQRLAGPAITVRAAGLFSWTEAKHPLLGYSLWLQVVRDEPLRKWQRRAIEALTGAGLASTFSWEEQDPHMAVLHDLPAPPAEVLVQLGSQDVELEFQAVRLVVSQRVGEGYVTWLDQPLDDAE
jgi:2'-5' RNA ligase